MKTHAQLKAQSLSQPEVKEAYDALAKGYTDLRNEHNLKLYIAGHPTPNSPPPPPTASSTATPPARPGTATATAP